MYTLYSGSGVFEENLVCSDVSRKFLLGVLDHILSDMEDGKIKKFTITAKKREEKDEEENYIHSSGPEEDESEAKTEELEHEDIFDSTDEDII